MLLFAWIVSTVFLFRFFLRLYFWVISFKCDLCTFLCCALKYTNDDRDYFIIIICFVAYSLLV